MTITPFRNENRSGTRRLHALPGWIPSAGGTSLTRRIGPVQVSLATDPDDVFVLTLTVPLDAGDEADAAALAEQLVEDLFAYACDPELACEDCGAPPIPAAD